jgi:phosphoglucosamine mutase
VTVGDLFGTNGVRGVVGETMTVELAQRLGRAVGAWTEGPVLVGRDPRTSGPALTRALVAGVTATGTGVRQAGLTPTPAVQRAVGASDATAGAIVTASHNPPEFNGIKVVKGDGTELVADEVAELERVYFDEAYEHAGWDGVGAVEPAPGVADAYGDAVLDEVGGALDEEDEAPTVVLDCANGAGCAVAPDVLQRLGADVVALNAQPDGHFPGHPSEPTPENVASTMQTVEATDADLGVVLDGDADRAVFVTGEGEYVPGERTLALVAAEAVREADGGLVVTPVSSSSCVEEHVQDAGGRVRYTAVGSPVVADVMKDERAVFGGEENGGLVFPDHQYCRDGTMTAAWLVKHVAESAASLAEMLDEVPRYTLVKESVPCEDEAKDAVLDAFADTVGADEVDRTDGVKAYHDDGEAWVLVRPSGTEPKVRVYAEAREAKRARELADDAKDRVRGLVD